MLIVLIILLIMIIVFCIYLFITVSRLSDSVKQLNKKLSDILSVKREESDSIKEDLKELKLEIDQLNTNDKNKDIAIDEIWKELLSIEVEEQKLSERDDGLLNEISDAFFHGRRKK